MPNVCKKIKARTDENKRIKARWISIRKSEVKPEERKVSLHDQIKLLAQLQEEAISGVSVPWYLLDFFLLFLTESN